MIKIYDDKLPLDLLIDCNLEVEFSNQYFMMHPVSRNANSEILSYKTNWTFLDLKEFSPLHIVPPEFTNEKLLRLWKEIIPYIPEPEKHRLKRGYINAHHFGVEDVIHQDDMDVPHGLTVIVYMCQSWYPEWYGQTTFWENLYSESKNDIIQSVLPRHNRFIIFDKNIPHSVAPLSRRFQGIRFTCMFKLERVE